MPSEKLPSPWPWARRSRPWDIPSVLDRILDSPLCALIYPLQALLLRLRGATLSLPPNKPAIRIVCISDTHCKTVALPPGDLLIHAGDAGIDGNVEELQKQMDWLDSQPHTHKVYVAGNHDSWFDPRSRCQQDRDSGAQVDTKSVRYLESESVTLRFDSGREVNIYGSPDIPTCHKPTFAFQYPRASPPWSNRVPMSTDILITHTPPHIHRDLNMGCPALLQEIWRVRPRLHVVGHVHAGHGREPLYWDEGQRAYERLMAGNGAGWRADFWPGNARVWWDAWLVLWYGVQGLLWQHLMLGSRGPPTLLVNAALKHEMTTTGTYPVEVVDF